MKKAAPALTVLCGNSMYSLSPTCGKGGFDMDKLISDAIDFAETLFSGESSGHDFSHTMRVYRLATTIAEKENADKRITALAALLHDVDDVKLFSGSHHAHDFLTEHEVDKETIGKILTIIRQVSFVGTDSVVPSTLEGKCVQDADRLDAIGAVGIARAFAYGGKHGRLMYDPTVAPNLSMNETEYRSHISTTINHFYEKLLLLKDMMSTPTARSLAQSRHEFLEQFLEEFKAEWNGEK